jgi:hydroxypyruvate isomerase
MKGRSLVSAHELGYLANCSLLFTEHPLLERATAAKDAGFDLIEFWWPFDSAVPRDADVDAFVSSIINAGVRLVGLNFFAGDLLGAECGVLSIPARTQEFRDNVAVAVDIGERLNVSVFNALYGNRVEDVAAAEQDDVGTENLVFAAGVAARIGAAVLVESVSGPKPYPLRSAADSLAVLDRAQASGAENVGFLCDVFHLANNGDDLDAVIARHAGRITHVQIADSPGRGEPGSGTLEIPRYLAALQCEGYAGFVGLEYKPTTDTVTSLNWLPRSRRATPDHLEENHRR